MLGPGWRHWLRISGQSGCVGRVCACCGLLGPRARAMSGVRVSSACRACEWVCAVVRGVRWGLGGISPEWDITCALSRPRRRGRRECHHAQLQAALRERLRHASIPDGLTWALRHHRHHRRDRSLSLGHADRTQRRRHPAPLHRGRFRPIDSRRHCRHNMPSNVDRAVGRPIVSQEFGCISRMSKQMIGSTSVPAAAPREGSQFSRESRRRARTSSRSQPSHPRAERWRPGATTACSA